MPCLHAEVRYGTQAWPSAAGVSINFYISYHFSLLKNEFQKPKKLKESP
jgi:hypothetical protein